MVRNNGNKPYTNEHLQRAKKMYEDTLRQAAELEAANKKAEAEQLRAQALELARKDVAEEMGKTIAALQEQIKQLQRNLEEANKKKGRSCTIC